MSDNVKPFRAGRKVPGAEEVAGYGCGAVVMLKSHGPAMTVRCAVEGSGKPKVSCDWFADGGELITSDFFVDQLQRVVVLPADEVSVEVEAETEH